MLVKCENNVNTNNSQLLRIILLKRGGLQTEIVGAQLLAVKPILLQHLRRLRGRCSGQARSYTRTLQA